MKYFFRICKIVETNKSKTEMLTSTLTNIRRCGECRCPGHTKRKCYVYNPKYRAYEEPWIAPSMNALEREKEHTRISRNGLTHKETTRVNYMKEWIRRNGTDGLIDWEIAFAELESVSVEEKDRQDEALDNRVRQRWNFLDQTNQTNQTSQVPLQTKDKPLAQADKVIEEDACPICMEPFTKVNHCVGHCGHQFHTACLFKACGADFAQRNKCPTCRQPLF